MERISEEKRFKETYELIAKKYINQFVCFFNFLIYEKNTSSVYCKFIYVVAYRQIVLTITLVTNSIYAKKHGNPHQSVVLALAKCSRG